MTARKVNVLRCDKQGCTEEVRAEARETATQLRKRAAKWQGWRSEPARGGHVDLCRWHA